MEGREVIDKLRHSGVVVHHAARMPVPLGGRQTVVVFLESTLGQAEAARQAALRIPGVTGVSFSGHTQAIMYISGPA